MRGPRGPLPCPVSPCPSLHPGAVPVVPLCPRARGPTVSPCPQWDTFPDVLALQYRWDGHLKSIGSTFMGSSPEFDLALYTLCYKARPDRE